MSNVYAGSFAQFGTDATATNNFVLKVPAAPDGTISLLRGNYGAESATIFSVSAAGAFAPVSLLDLSGAAAGQIKFPATQNASSDVNTLDDYEEGTWVPNQGSGLAVTGAFTSGGAYTKVGRQVTVTGYVGAATAMGLGAGGQILSNLPFTVGATGPFAGASSNGTVTQAGSCYVSASSTQMFGTAITAAGNTAILFTCTYFV